MTLKNDQLLISPYNITLELHISLKYKGNNHKLKELPIVK